MGRQIDLNQIRTTKCPNVLMHGQIRYSEQLAKFLDGTPKTELENESISRVETIMQNNND
jgi:hypothetical protein